VVWETRWPSAARRRAGSQTSAQVTRCEPYFSIARAKPATEPGTPEAFQPTVEEPSPLRTLPSGPTYMSREAAAGAVSR